MRRALGRDMASTLTDRAAARERNSLLSPCGMAGKADLRAQVAPVNLREVADDARRATMKLEAAADAVGLSESRLSHKFSDGTVTLAMLEQMGAAYVLEFVRLLTARVEPLVDPKARGRQMLREIRQKCDELEQFLEFIA